MSNVLTTQNYRFRKMTPTGDVAAPNFGVFHLNGSEWFDLSTTDDRPLAATFQIDDDFFATVRLNQSNIVW
jgi:hypothetical protein